MDSKLGVYKAPKTTVVAILPRQCLLVTSNEGLDYEDLFASQMTDVNDEPFEVVF